METDAAEHKAYWRKNSDDHLARAGVLGGGTVLIGLYAREARELTAIYALITGLYGWYLSRQDRFYGC